MSLFNRLLLFLSINGVFGQNFIVDNMKQCVAKDKTKLDDCIRHSIEVDLKKLISMGDKNLNVKAMDPIIVDKIVYNQEGAALKATATLTNVRLIGLAITNFHFIKYDKPTRTVYFNTSAPLASGTANYVIKGSILLVPVDGQGVVNFNLTDAVGSAVVQFEPQTVPSRLKTLKFDMDARDTSAHFERLASRDPLSEAVSKVISDNSRLIFEDIKPIIIKEMEKAIFNGLKDIIVLPAEILNV